MITKVKSVQASGSFENAYGAIQDNAELPNHGKKLLYKFEYVMEDGVVITANHKTTTSPFQAGSDVEYEVKKDDPEYGKSGTVKKPDTGNFNAPRASKGGVGEDLRQLMIVRQSSLNRAVEILIHNSSLLSEDHSYEDKAIDEIEVIELAGLLTKWVMGEEKKKEETPKVAEVVAEAKIGEEPADEPLF